MPDRPKVVVAEPIASAGRKVLADSCLVIEAAGWDQDRLLASLSDADALVVRSATRVDAGLIEAAPSLRVIGRAGVGVDNIDVEAATRRGVLVVNAPQANIVSAAEHTMALLLAQARRLPEADARTRSGRWERSDLMGVELQGKVLGVIGLGRVGSLVSQRAQGFGMQVVAHDPFVSAEHMRRLGIEPVDLEALLATSDFISIHLPLTAGTAGLLGKDRLARCKPGVRIVNTSRGGIIDERALAEALRSGQVAGAALDVFETEPLIDSPLYEFPQVVLTPHLGASTVEAQDKAGTQVAQAVVAALRGELVLSAVNVDLGKEVPDEVQDFVRVAEQLGRVFIGLARQVPGEITVRAEGRIGRYETKPLGLAILKGALQSVSTSPVSYVNVAALAAEKGIRLVEEATEESEEYVSLVKVSGLVRGQRLEVAATLARKGPILVEILGHEVELPISRYLLIVRNADVPGLIGRVGTYLGDAGINIANMVVGRSRLTGDAAMMGLNLDQPLSEEQVVGLRAVPGVMEARFIEL
jgi:D-3-phosphoglycerate dehydrogenase